MITQLPRNTKLTREDLPTELFYQWMLKVSQLGVMTGSGSPEGVISAPITTFYMDTAGTAENILYIKRDPDISGDRSQGWILV